MMKISLLHVPVIILQDATINSLFISVNCSTCFGWNPHPSSGAHIIVPTASGISVTAMDKINLLIMFIIHDNLFKIVGSNC
jgi:hypothetical protein